MNSLEDIVSEMMGDINTIVASAAIKLRDAQSATLGEKINGTVDTLREVLALTGTEFLSDDLARTIRAAALIGN